VKIAIVVNSAWAAYNFRLNLARKLSKEGFEVVFIIPFDNKYSERLRLEFESFNLRIYPKSLNPFKELIAFFNLFRIYRNVKPDLACHFTIKLNIYGSISAYLCGIPNISNITGLGSAFLNKSIFKFTAKKLYKFALSFSSKVFFQNSEDLNYFLEKNLISESKIELIPGSGVDLGKFKFTPIVNYKKFIFLMISRVIRDKGIYEYIEAIRTIKKTKKNYHLEFQLLGEVNLDSISAIKKNELNQWVDEGLIRYLGVTDEVQNYIIDCNCVVLPSYREGMPRAVLESYAIGRPCIVSNVPGCREIVDHKKNGLICKVKSSHDLAKKMVLMIEFPEDIRTNYANNGREKIVNHFDEKIVINAYLKSINNLLKNEKNI
jgi:glycosyltransferase involved in cell wall biosynthesis